MLHTELRSYLQLHGVRPVEFARFLGVSRDIVWRWTSGRSPVPLYIHVILSLLPEEDVSYFIKGGLELVQFEPWQTLGIARDSDLGKAKAAYRKLAKRSHSDVGGDEENMKKVNLAWETLKNA